MDKPINTNATATHCRCNSALPNIMTDTNIVKNFRVVVKTAHVNGPNSVIVVKMKSWPIALAELKAKRLRITSG